jgi:flagellar basal-body rod protein FlgF
MPDGGRLPGDMERGLYIAASGMVAEMARQDQLANDLANAATPGYKADRSAQHAFGALLVRNLHQTPVGQIAQGARVERQVTDLRPQGVRDTGEPLDLAVDGEGFFAVQTPEGVRFTRNGAFRAAADSTLVDQLGNRVLGPGGAPVAVRGGEVDRRAVGVFAVPDARKVGEALFTGAATGQATGRVRTGALELSGVEAARTMVDMMASLRAIEAVQRAITTIDGTLEKAANQVASMRG